MKVLLIQANTKYSSILGTHFDGGDISTSPEISDHLGLGYLSAYLKSKGIECQIIDAALLNLSNEELINKCIKYSPSLIGLTFIHDTYAETLETYDELSANLDSPIIIGGHLPTVAGKDIFNFIPELKYAMIGEAEESLYQFCKAFKKRDFSQVPNLIYQYKNGEIIQNSISKNYDLDLLPFPVRIYANEIFKIQSKNSLPKALRIHGSRGCHGSCNFCSINAFRSEIYGKNNWIPRSINSIVDEILYLNQEFGVSCFYFSDDNFLGPNNIQKKRLLQFCKKIQREKLNIKFSITTRIDGLSYSLIMKLIDAGLCHIGVGLENINNIALNSLGKGYFNDKIIDLVKIGNELPVSISISISMILYHPFATIEEIYDNYLFLKQIGYFDSKIKNRNAFDTLFQSRVMIRKYTKLENIILNKKLHNGYHTKNPFIVKYSFEDKRVEVFWNSLYNLCKDDYTKVEDHFKEEIRKYV